jgi:hypothetical protein
VAERHCNPLLQATGDEVEEGKVRSCSALLLLLQRAAAVWVRKQISLADNGLPAAVLQQ